MTDLLMEKLELRQRAAKFQNRTGEPSLGQLLVGNLTEDEFTTLMSDYSDYHCNRGVLDILQEIIPMVEEDRKLSARVRGWLHDWTLSAPLDDIEAYAF